jgi:indolepyruvate ferredoxin oxidoreductase beta subunit
VTGPIIPEHRAAAVVSLEPLEALRVLGAYGHSQVVVLTNDRPLYPINVISGADAYPDPAELKKALAGLCARLYWLPATDAAMELGAPILANVIMLGALCASGLLPVGAAEIEAALGEMFPEAKMGPNRQALKQGQELLAAA